MFVGWGDNLVDNIFDVNIGGFVFIFLEII